jgi:hypothetical protein
VRIELHAPLGHVEPPEPPPSRHDRHLRNLALALHIQELIASGRIKNQAEVARLCEVSRARISQVMDLVRFAPSVREWP